MPNDIDVDRGTVFIRSGKGQKDRMVPIGERALDWVERYRAEVRPTWARSTEEPRLFLTHRGQSFTASRMTQLVRDDVRQANIGKTGGCHAFRHTMATLMLQGGADTRHIQEMLGHASLKTTPDLHEGVDSTAEGSAPGDASEREARSATGRPTRMATEAADWTRHSQRDRLGDHHG